MVHVRPGAALWAGHRSAVRHARAGYRRRSRDVCGRGRMGGRAAQSRAGAPRHRSRLVLRASAAPTAVRARRYGQARRRDRPDRRPRPVVSLAPAPAPGNSPRSLSDGAQPPTLLRHELAYAGEHRPPDTPVPAGPQRTLPLDDARNAAGGSVQRQPAQHLPPALAAQARTAAARERRARPSPACAAR